MTQRAAPPTPTPDAAAGRPRTGVRASGLVKILPDTPWPTDRPTDRPTDGEGRRGGCAPEEARDGQAARHTVGRGKRARGTRSRGTRSAAPRSCRTETDGGRARASGAQGAEWRNLYAVRPKRTSSSCRLDFAKNKERVVYTQKTQLGASEDVAGKETRGCSSTGTEVRSSGRLPEGFRAEGRRAGASPGPPGSGSSQHDQTPRKQHSKRYGIELLLFR